MTDNGWKHSTYLNNTIYNRHEPHSPIKNHKTILLLWECVLGRAERSENKIVGEKIDSDCGVGKGVSACFS